MGYRVFASMFIKGEPYTSERILSQPLSQEAATKTAAAIRHLNTFPQRAIHGFPNYIVGADVVDADAELPYVVRAAEIPESGMDDFVRQWFAILNSNHAIHNHPANITAA